MVVTRIAGQKIPSEDSVEFYAGNRQSLNYGNVGHSDDSACGSKSGSPFADVVSNLAGR